MGIGSSMPKQGVRANPRVVFADRRAKQSKDKRKFVIDTPVLVDVDHGSIRYRFSEEETDRRIKAKKLEVPYEGGGVDRKGHYFYHPRLNDFSENASVDKEEPQKFMYVMKGPTRAKQKKVFYVYGKGWLAKDGQVTKPSKTRAMGADPSWPQRQFPNDVYYDIEFINATSVEEPIAGIPNRHKMKYSLTGEDKVDDLRFRIAHTIIKSAANIHVCYQLQELKGEDLVWKLRNDDEQPENFAVEVSLMDH